MNFSEYFRFNDDEKNEEREYMLWVYAVRFLDICALLSELASAKCAKFTKEEIRKLCEMAATCRDFARKLRRTLEGKE